MTSQAAPRKSVRFDDQPSIVIIPEEEVTVRSPPPQTQGQSAGGVLRAGLEQGNADNGNSEGSLEEGEIRENEEQDAAEQAVEDDGGLARVERMLDEQLAAENAEISEEERAQMAEYLFRENRLRAWVYGRDVGAQDDADVEADEEGEGEDEDDYPESVDPPSDEEDVGEIEDEDDVSSTEPDNESDEDYAPEEGGLKKKPSGKKGKGKGKKRTRGPTASDSSAGNVPTPRRRSPRLQQRQKEARQNERQQEEQGESSEGASGLRRSPRLADKRRKRRVVPDSSSSSEDDAEGQRSNKRVKIDNGSSHASFASPNTQSTPSVIRKLRRSRRQAPRYGNSLPEGTEEEREARLRAYQDARKKATAGATSNTDADDAHEPESSSSSEASEPIAPVRKITGRRRGHATPSSSSDPNSDRRSSETEEGEIKERPSSNKREHPDTDTESMPPPPAKRPAPGPSLLDRPYPKNQAPHRRRPVTRSRQPPQPVSDSVAMGTIALPRIVEETDRFYRLVGGVNSRGKRYTGARYMLKKDVSERVVGIWERKRFVDGEEAEEGEEDDGEVEEDDE